MVWNNSCHHLNACPIAVLVNFQIPETRYSAFHDPWPFSVAETGFVAVAALLFRAALFP
jgi:hypothetical protein